MCSLETECVRFSLPALLSSQVVQREIGTKLSHSTLMDKARADEVRTVRGVRSGGQGGSDGYDGMCRAQVRI